MEKRLLALLMFFVFATWIAQAQPSLTVDLFDRQNIQISWPSTTTGLVLEQTTALSQVANWQAVNATPVLQNSRWVAHLPLSQTSQFFRLHQTISLTTIFSSSPVDGETGVAVTRETILRFSGPLSTNALVGTNNFYAGFGGRRILSRAELSSDRRQVTLFYLEPLPGNARVVVVFDGNLVRDAADVLVDADGNGTPGGQAVMSFETLSLTPLIDTAVIGTVYASELLPGSDTGTNAVNKPLGGVTITVDGMEQSLRTVTDTNGNFKLNPVPPGRFFVHIDGRTVNNLAANIHYPDKSYYPFVGKAWNAVAGRTDNLAGGTGKIYLPLITAGTLQPVSLTNDTVITFPTSVVSSNPALAGVSITVPANSLFSDNGSRGGKVGIAAVAPDRLPGPLPEGLELPIVITVQTDGGLNFDRPAPICFPNLPDPVLKTPLPANSKQALISFNHDKGIWEAVGSMTVSADGKVICTDPGAGILQPGWHGVGPLPDGPPPPPKPFPCKKDSDVEECILFCQIEFDECNRKNDLTHALDEMICDALTKNNLFTEAIRCRIEQLQNHLDRQDACNDVFVKCLSRCKPCPPQALSALKNDYRALEALPQRTPRIAPASRKAADPVDPIDEQIEAILERIRQLLRPFAVARSPIPPDVQSEIDALNQQADVLAGGNVGGYLTSRIITGEEALAAAARTLGDQPDDLNPGNAPSYPVLYAATISRPDGLFVLRGETGPFGQYSLFVPRDGILLGVSFYDARTRGFGIISPNLSPKAAFDLPRFTLFQLPGDALDFDHDGLPDAVEGVLGTDPEMADSDGDGLFDGAEVDQGTNPLDGMPVRTGIVGTVKTPGSAVDVAAVNDLLVVAEGTSGVSVFNLFSGMSPVLIAQVDTPGMAQSVALSGNFAAVADGEDGLAIIDLSDPAKARLVSQVALGLSAQAVAAAGNFAYVVLINLRLANEPSFLVKVDLLSGFEIDRLPLGRVIGNVNMDVAVAGDDVYVLDPRSLLICGETNGSLSLLGQSVIASGGDARQLFVGGGLAYVGQLSGHSVVDVSNPSMPVLTGKPPTAQLGLESLAMTGSGLLVATITRSGPNLGTNAQQVALYDASVPTNVTKFLTLFDTPGEARALTIHNGLGYVADSAAGIQVINYLPFDRNKVAPSISLSTSAEGGVAKASTPLRITANAIDDVQVRNVEFYIDGQQALSDGNFPFEHRFVPPLLTANKTNITVRARAIDTGGNSTWSEELTIKLEADVTPPHITATTPLGGAKVVRSVVAYFNEAMSPATLNAASFQLISASADGLLDTPDDLPVSGGVVTYHSQNSSVSLDLAAALPEGFYRAVMKTDVADAAGNRLANDYHWEFRVADAVFWSRNGDGLWEERLNWSTGAVPGANDIVFIESIDRDVTITHVSDTNIIRSLVVGERLTLINNSTLQVSDTIELHESLSLNGGIIKGGTLRNNAGGRLVFDSNGANTLEGVSVVGDLQVTNSSARLLIRNGLSVTGSVLLANDAAISFSGNQTFQTGQVIFGNSGLLGIEPGTTLTLGPTTVVRGKSGRIGASMFHLSGNRQLISQGLISADVAGGALTLTATHFESFGMLECKNGGAVILEGESRNNGRIDASGGGSLTVNGTWSNLGTISVNDGTLNLGGTFKLADLGTLHRTGGTINVTGVLDLGGGALAFDATSGSWSINGGTIKNGTVTQNGGANVLFAANAGNTLDGINVVGDVALTNAGARLLIRNGLSLTGSVLLDNEGTISFSGTQTFDSAQVIFAGNSGLLGIEPGTTLTLGPAMVIRGKSGRVGPSMFNLSGVRQLINQGLISADVAGGTLTISSTPFENSGRILADGTGASVVIRVTPFTNTGTIQELNGGKVLINP